MKAIMISIRPKHTCNILNGKKKKEIRTSVALANAVKKLIAEQGGCWVYIYCSLSGLGLYDNRNHITSADDVIFLDEKGYDKPPLLNGKVVARFWCNRVEEVVNYGSVFLVDEDIAYTNLIARQSCLSFNELADYAKGKNCFALNITKLEIFDKPKELSEYKKCYRSKGYPQNQNWYLTKAPQNFTYIEV